MPTPSKKAKKMTNYDVHTKHYVFSCQTTFKKAKFMEFGLKNANLSPLYPESETAQLTESKG